MDSALAQTPSSLLPAVEFQKPQAIDKIRYSHDAMVDMIVANPWISQGELAKAFGYTEGWVSQVLASDAFQGRLAERKNELVDPVLRATIEERFKALVLRSYEVLMRKLEKPIDQISDELALKTMEIAAKAAGYGSRGAQVQINQSFAVALPQKEPTTDGWAAKYGAGGSPVVNSPAFKAGNTVQDAVLVEPRSAAPTPKQDGAALLSELKGL